MDHIVCKMGQMSLDCILELRVCPSHSSAIDYIVSIIVIFISWCLTTIRPTLSSYIHSIPKQFSDFEKIQKKSKKDPFYTQNWKNPKKHLFKGRRSGQIDFFLFFDPPKCACSDSKTVFGFGKKPKKI